MKKNLLIMFNIMMISLFAISVFSDSDNISLVSPTETDLSYLNVSEIRINSSVDAVDFSNQTFYLFNSTDDIINETLVEDAISYIKYTALSDGVYTFYVNYTDTNEDIYSSETRSVTIDTIKPPKVTNLTNTELTYKSATWTWLNASDYGSVDIYVNNVYQLTTTGLTYTASGLTQDTAYTLSVYTFDLARNGNGTAVTSSVTTTKNNFQSLDGFDGLGTIIGSFITNLIFGLSGGIVGLIVIGGVILMIGSVITLVVIMIKKGTKNK